MEHYVITIARGFGSGGKALGMRLAQELGINCYENRILALASEITGRETSELLELDEKLKKGSVHSLLSRLPRRTEPVAVEKKFQSEKEIFECQCDIIKKLAKTESCIIIGKCADYVLKDFDHVISLYIEAPRAYCLKRIMNRMKINEKEANRLIEKTDSYRAEYYKYYTGGNYWTNPVNYDMTFNMARVGEDRAISMIKTYLELMFGIDNQQDMKATSERMFKFANNPLTQKGE